MKNPNSDKEWFEEWFDTAYYHILYQNRNEKEARDFIDRLLGHLKPASGARMLDLACGRGRYARYLAGKGFDVTGVDLSVNNIQYARQFEEEHLQFYMQDMRRPFRSNYYHYIFNFFTSFGYFDHERDHVRTLQNIAKGLQASGRFVLDYFNSRYVARHLLRREVKTIAGIRFHIGRQLSRDRIQKNIDVFENGRRLQFLESVRLFLLEDFARLFNQTGLRIVDTFGDYQLRPFDPEHSPRLILIAKRNDGNTTI